MPDKDPLVESAERVMRVATQVIETLEQLDDEGRIRVVRAVQAFFMEVTDADLAAVATARRKALKSLAEMDVKK